jgi:hypothetical protein
MDVALVFVYSLYVRETTVSTSEAEVCSQECLERKIGVECGPHPQLEMCSYICLIL